MNRLKKWLDRGWYFEVRATGDGFYEASLTHNSYGFASSIKESLTEAFNKTIKQAKDITKEFEPWRQ